MATLVLQTVGTIVGGPIGGAIGSFIGSQVDRAIIGGGPDRVGPRLAEVSVQTSSYGTAIPQVFGNMRVAGSVIWATDLQENSNREGGGKGRPSATVFSYSANFAVAISSRPIASIGRIWADGNLLRGVQGDFKTETVFRFYNGKEDQDIDPLIASAEGAMNASAHRGIAYAIFENFQLADFGNRIPSLTFEVIDSDGQVKIVDIVDQLIPGLVALHTSNIQNDIGVLGYAVSTSTSREAIDNILSPLPISLRANDRFLELITSGQGANIVQVNSLEAMNQNNNNVESAQFSTVPISEIPKEWALRYYDPSREYQAGLQNSRRPGPGRRSVTIDFPAVIDAIDAHNIAQTNQRQAISGRHLYKIHCVRDDQIYKVGDIIYLENLQPYHWQINEIEEDLGVRSLSLLAVPNAAVQTMSPINAPGRSIISRDEPSGTTILEILDLPSLGSSAATAPNIAIAAAGTQSGWRRANLFNREGTDIVSIGPTSNVTMVGRVSTPLGASSPYVYDEYNRPQIKLANNRMELPLRQTVMGAASLSFFRPYFAMIGEEIIQFREAVLLPNDVYELRGLCRGLGGTEEYIHNHRADERFVFLDNERLQYLDINNLSLGQNITLEALGVGDEVPQIASINNIGRALRPLAPVHGNAILQHDGSIAIGWIRRNRTVSNWSDGVDIPLDDGAEQYALRVQNEQRILIDVILNNNKYLITQSIIAFWQMDNIDNIDIIIKQIGVHARSEPLMFNHKIRSI